MIAMSIKIRHGYLYEIRCGGIVERQEVSSPGMASMRFVRLPLNPTVNLRGGTDRADGYTLQSNTTFDVLEETGMRSDGYRALDVVREISPD